VVKFVALAVPIFATSCGYGAGFRDCTIECSEASGCPDGFSCGVEGLCRSGETTTACAAASDAGSEGALGVDAPGDVAPRDLVLSESGSDDVTEAAYSCTPSCGDVVISNSPVSLDWYREFTLSDFAAAPLDVTGSFQITAIHVGCSTALGSASFVTTVYGYSGALFASTLDTAALTQLGNPISTQVQNCTDDIVVPVDVSSIAAGSAFVVEIADVDLFYDNGQNCGVTTEFHLGANGSAETRGSYEATSCPGAISAPALWTNDDALITVEGTAN
jgi:hypothetical protein